MSIYIDDDDDDTSSSQVMLPKPTRGGSGLGTRHALANLTNNGRGGLQGGARQGGQGKGKGKAKSSRGVHASTSSNSLSFTGQPSQQPRAQQSYQQAVPLRPPPHQGHYLPYIHPPQQQQQQQQQRQQHPRGPGSMMQPQPAPLGVLNVGPFAPLRSQQAPAGAVAKPASLLVKPRNKRPIEASKQVASSSSSSSSSSRVCPDSDDFKRRRGFSSSSSSKAAAAAMSVRPDSDDEDMLDSSQVHGAANDTVYDDSEEEDDLLPTPMDVDHTGGDPVLLADKNGGQGRKELTDEGAVENPADNRGGDFNDLSNTYMQDNDWPLDATWREYEDSIYRFSLENETRTRPSPTYLEDVQKELTGKMRSVLVDWLVDVTVEFRLKTETLYLSVNYVDRFLSRVSIRRNRMQLVGVAAMLIASKYEEIDPPTVDDFAYISNDTYTGKQVLEMESFILDTLNFCVTVATPPSYLTRFVRASGDSEQVRFLTFFLMERFMAEPQYLHYASSVVCSAALYLARRTCNGTDWSPALIDCTGYRLVHILSCATDLLAMHQRVYRTRANHQLQATLYRFSHDTVGRVGSIRPLGAL